MKEEHRKSERIDVQVASFDYDNDGFFTLIATCGSRIQVVSGRY